MAISEFLGMYLRGAYLSFHRQTQAHFNQYGVTADQFVLLALLAEEPGSTQQQLARRSYSDANTIAAILNRLEKKKLVRRLHSPHDGRAWRILLTARGRNLHARLQRSVRPLHGRLDATLPGREQQRVRQWLRRVIAGMSATPLRARKASARRRA